MTQLKNFEDFKKNLQFVEKKLTSVGEEFVNNARIAITWVAYLQNDQATEQEIKFIGMEYIPNIVKIILNKKNDMNKNEILVIQELLESVLLFLARCVGKEEHLNKTLEMIFDGHQPLYQRLYSNLGLTNSKSSTSSLKIAQHILDSLDVGSCFDYMVSQDKWEIAIVESFSSHRTDVEILLPSSDTKKWISVEKNFNSIAAFGTKTNISQPDTTHFASSIQDDIIINESMLIKNVPSVGDIIDAKNSNGIWLLACVMEIKEEEQQEPVVIDMTKNQDETASESDEAEASSKKYFIRVAFLGYPESSDEWILFDNENPRLLYPEVASKGKKGDSPIRPEIFYLSEKVHSGSHHRDKFYAIYALNTFMPPLYIQLINHFGNHRGFTLLLQSLTTDIKKYFEITKEQHGSNSNTLNAELAKVLPLINSMGMIGRYLSKEFLQFFIKDFNDQCRKLFVSGIIHDDIRHLNIDYLEQILRHLESLYYSAYGRTIEAGKPLEIMRLSLGIRLLSCPFLNKRLSGLKLINELLKRAQNLKLYPTGIKKTIHVKTNQSKTQELISYHVQPITYCLSRTQICDLLMKANIFFVLYDSNQLHDSLISRSTMLLSSFCDEDLLDRDMIHTLLRVGMDKSSTVYSLFSEIASSFSPSKMVYILEFLENMSPKNVITSIIEMVTSLALKCRQILLSTTFENSELQSELKSDALIAHRKILEILCLWAQDSADLDVSLISLCTEKLAIIIESGYRGKGTNESSVSFTQTTPDSRSLSNSENVSDINWEMHWKRNEEFIIMFMKIISKTNNLFLAMSLVKSFLQSWPTTWSCQIPTGSISEAPLGIRDRRSSSVSPCDQLPFTPCKSEVISYLIETYDLLNILTNCMVNLKSTFNHHIETHSIPLDQWNKIKLPNTYHTYVEQLEAILEIYFFIFHYLVPLPENFENHLINLWKSLVINAKISEEVEVVITFFMKIPWRSNPNNTNDRPKSPEPLEDNSISKLNYFQSSQDVFIWIFQTLLCDELEDGSLYSPWFSVKSMRCIERWFGWINSELGFITLGKDWKVASVLVEPSKIIGVEVFLKLAFDSRLEAVGNMAVSMLTCLAQLTSSIKTSDELKFTDELLQICFEHMGRACREHKNSQNNSSHESPHRLTRVLLLFNSLIQDSYTKSSSKLFAHGSLTEGTIVSFKVSCTSKNIKNMSGTIQLRSNQIVSDLVNNISQLVKLPANEIKIFRLGKEILEQDYRKTISLLPNLNDKETLVVVEKPKLAIEGSKSGSNSAATTPRFEDKSIKSFPDDLVNVDSKFEDIQEQSSVYKISQDPEYANTFFALLKASDEQSVNAIWNSISELPTFHSILNPWLRLQCKAIDDLFSFPLQPLHIHRLGEVFYSLQIIEILLNPTCPVQDIFPSTVLEGIDIQNLSSKWCTKFIQMNGIIFLFKVLEWISFALRTYVNSIQQAESKPKGLSMTLLLSSLHLNLKLLRGFLVRQHISNFSKCDLDFLLTFYERNDEENIKYNAIKTLIDQLSNNGNLTKDELVNSVLINEWGNHIVNLQHSSAILKSTKSATYWSLVSIIISLIQLNLPSPNDIKDADSTNSSKLLPKYQESKEKKYLHITLQNIVFIWVSLIILNPKFLLEKQFYHPFDPNYSISYESLIHSGLIASNNHTNTYFSDIIIKDWYANALAFFFVSIRSFTPDVKTTTLLQSHWMQLIFDMRPKVLFVLKEKHTPKNTHSTLYFDLVKQLLTSNEGKYNKSILSSDLWRMLCNQIIQELKAVSREAVQTLTPSIADSHPETHRPMTYLNLSGNIQILLILFQYSDDPSIISFFDRSLVDVLLNDFLGFQEFTSTLSAHPLTWDLIDSMSRKLVYDLLIAILVRNPMSLTLRVFKTLKEIHQQLKPLTSWEFSPEKESRSPFGYVGLRNLGSTCYMNSLIQSLFMHEEIQSYILSLGLDHSNILPSSLEESDPSKYSTLTTESLLFQLYKMFLNLKFSLKKYYTPYDFFGAIKDVTGTQPLDVKVQQDAQEFFHLLCDRFESNVMQWNNLMANSTNATSVFPINDVLHLSYGGKLSDLKYVYSDQNTLEETNTASENIRRYGIREHEENFVCISLNVSQQNNLLNSLNEFIQGEKITDFTWDSKGLEQQRVTIMKRQLFSELSNSLIFHFKRFKINFDTFVREKVNDYFPFPRELNMKPYMKESQDFFSHQSNGVKRPDSYYLYHLTGIIIHTGTSDSGHYYAFLQDLPNDHQHSGAWYEFNDADIKEFFIQNQLESECYGGSNSVHEYNLQSQSFNVSQSINSKNAYMVIYQRDQKLVIPNGVRPISSVDNSVLFHQSSKIYQKIMDENKEQLILQNVLTPEYFQFYTKLLSHFIQQSFKQKKLIPSAMISEACRFLCSFVAHYNFSGLNRTEKSSDGSVVQEFTQLRDTILEAMKLCDLEVDQDGNPIKRVTGGNLSRSHSRNPSNASDYDHAPVPPPPPAIKDILHSETLAQSPNSALLPPKPPSHSSGDHSLPPPIPSDTPVKRSSSFISLFGESSIGVQQSLSLQIISNLLEEPQAIIDSLLSPPSELMRESIRVFYTSILNLGWEIEKPSLEIIDNIAMKSGTLSNINAVQLLHGQPVDPAILSSVSVEDPELALALKMSTEALNASVPVKPESGPQPLKTLNIEEINQLGLHGAISSLCIRFIFALTMDIKLQLLGESWRRSKQYIELLIQFSQEGAKQKQLLIQRDMIAQCVDLILGDQSPLCGQLYQAKSRKRAPTSYITLLVHPSDPTTASNSVTGTNTSSAEYGPKPLSESQHGSKNAPTYLARNTPDWTKLLDLLVILVQECTIERDQQASNSLFIPVDALILSEWDKMCIQSKTFYRTMIKQSRYHEAMMKLVNYLSLDNRTFSLMFCEVLYEEFSSVSADNMVFLFELLHQFLNIDDSLTKLRFFSFFGRGGTQNLLELMRNFKTDSLKITVVISFLRSLLALISLHRDHITETLATPREQIAGWSSWIVQFIDSNISKTVSGSNNTLTLKVSIRVFGEEEVDRSLTWFQRLEKVQTLCFSLLQTWGVNPASLQETKPTPVVSHPTQSNGFTSPQAKGSNANNSLFGAGNSQSPRQVSSKHQVVENKFLQLADGMTDEEIALVLSNPDID